MIKPGTKVLVTGADGFIGSHLVEVLVKHGANVRAFVFYNSFNSWGWLDSLPKEVIDQVEIFSGDIRDPHGTADALHGCDVVFHLAALIAIPFSYHSPDAYVDTNVKGTLNILQAAKKYETERVIVTSTSEVYGTALYAPIDELHPLQAQSPYSATKIAADSLAKSFFCSFNTPVTTVRPFNTYGPRQSARAVIPTVITQLLDGQEKLYLGSTSPTRDFNYVEDTVAGFIALAGCDDTIGEEVNISSGTEHSIADVADILVDQINPNAKIIAQDQRMRPEKSEVFRLLGDNTKIKKFTDWEPQFSLEQGLKQTIDWFSNQKNLSHYKSNIYNI